LLETYQSAWISDDRWIVDTIAFSLHSGPLRFATITAEWTIPMIIAIDGPAASGKGTLAAGLARHFGLPSLDTGLLYRAVGLAMLDSGAQLTDAPAAVSAAQQLRLDALDGERLRGKDMGEAASVVSAIPELRAALLDLQRTFAAQSGGAVLDGRDIGTVICPQADIKLFVTAKPETRASRRTAELIRRGEKVDPAEVLADIRRRDARDSSRADAPLTAAADAHILDTSDLDAEQTFSLALKLATQIRAPIEQPKFPRCNHETVTFGSGDYYGRVS